jgi:hypothetical protein
MRLGNDKDKLLSLAYLNRNSISQTKENLNMNLIGILLSSMVVIVSASSYSAENQFFLVHSQTAIESHVNDNNLFIEKTDQAEYETMSDDDYYSENTDDIEVEQNNDQRGPASANSGLAKLEQAQLQQSTSINGLQNQKQAGESQSQEQARNKQSTHQKEREQSTVGANPTLPAYIQYYQKRYSLSDTSTKLVDNHGEGFGDLYGVRNFRTVLNGVLYRGGANNVYNKNKVRDNRNPLPAEGLANLCKEGFRNVFYMYTTNYDKNSNPVNCKTERGPDSKLEIKMNYLQKGPWDRNSQHEILKTIHDNILNPSSGPVYLHCWNGWHASGLISSFSLKQFCNYSGDQAARYWDLNTDGNNKGKAYESYRGQIRSFVPFEDLKLPVEVMSQICLPPPSSSM